MFTVVVVVDYKSTINKLYNSQYGVFGATNSQYE